MSNFQVENAFVKTQMHSVAILLKNKRLQFYISIVAVIVITFFLSEAEPYNISRWHDHYKILKLSGYGFIYVGTTCLCLCLTPKNTLFPAMLNLKTLFRLGCMLILFVVCTGILNWLYSEAIYVGYTANVSTLFKSIKHVFSFSLLFLLYYLWHLQWRSRRYRQKMVEQNKGELITFDKFYVIHTDIMLIKSDENYIFLYYMFENSPKRIHFRYKISDAEKQLMVYTQFVRVRKSYLVNMMYINRDNLDLKSMILRIDGINEKIIIGKTFKCIMKNWLAANADYLSQISRN